MPAFNPGSFTIGYPMLLKFTRALAALVCECRVHIKDGEARVFTVDSANVGLIDIRMAVQGYPGSAVLGLDIAQLDSALRCITEGEPAPEGTVTLSWSAGRDPVRPYLDIDGIGKDRYRIETLDETTIRKDTVGFKADLPAVFSCSGDDFARAVRICGVFSDKCRIEVLKTGVVTMAAMGDTRTQCKIPIAICGGSAIAASLFSLDYLKDLSRVLAGHQLSVEMGTDHPIRITAAMAPGLTVAYALAPRIESDDTLTDTAGWL